jgi:tetratricopeptide (TPR) repeat protein
MTTTLNIDSLWNFGDPADSEQRFRQALANANDSEKLELETQIARTYGLRRDYERAHAMLDDVERRLTQTSPEVVRVRVALERGRTIRVERDFEQARSHFQQAFDRARDAGLTILAIDAAHMFGFSKSLDEAMQWNERAMQIARSTDVPRAIQWRATLANNMGVSERGRKNYAIALSHFHAAHEAEMTLGRANRIFLANWQIANVYRLQGKFAEALDIQKRLLAEMIKENTIDAYVYDELAELYALNGEHEKATFYATASLRLAEKDEWVLKNEQRRVDRLRELAQPLKTK